MAAGNETSAFIRDGSMLPHHDIDTSTTPNSWKPKGYQFQDCASADRPIAASLRIQTIDEMAAENKGYYMDIAELGGGCVPTNRSGCIDSPAITQNASGEMFKSAKGATTWTKIESAETNKQEAASGGVTTVRHTTGLPPAPTGGRVQIFEELGSMTILNNNPCRTMQAAIRQTGRLRLDKSKSFVDNNATQSVLTEMWHRVNGGGWIVGMAPPPLAYYGAGQQEGSEATVYPDTLIFIPPGGSAVIDTQVTYLSSGTASNEMAFQVLFNAGGYSVTKELL